MEKTYDLIVHQRHYAVTQTQVDACERATYPATKETYYKVKSATTPGMVYVVRYLQTLERLVCSCPAGLGLNCWHRRGVLVSERLFKAALRAQFETAKREIEASAEYHAEVSKHTAEQALVAYHEGLREAAGAGDEAAKRELKAFRKYGEKAYGSEGFNLLK
jgi:hypothetical protein